jgi:hypothetical protein
VPTEIDPDAVVTAGAIDVDAGESDAVGGDAGDGDAVGGDAGDGAENADDPVLYAGTECEILDHEERDHEILDPEKGDHEESDHEEGGVSVRFRTGEQRSLPADAVAEIPDETTGEAVAAAAREYMGTEYVWGGMTVEGIDCSGLTWQAYHRHGVALPRDADLQRRMGEEIPRDELRAGDLLFFPGHVAVSLGGSRFVHAYGSADEVVVGSLDPESDRYEADLDESFALATRLV